jgi:hypothetical protein
MSVHEEVLDRGRSSGHLTPARLRELLARDRARVSRFAVSVPVAVWLVCLVAAATLIQLPFVRRVAAPWVFPDEIIYSELAKNFAATGQFAVRDEPMLSYGVLYSLLIAPAFAIWDSLPDAYAAAKAINALLMALAAVPAYLLARFVLPRGLAFLAAVLAVAVPSTAYSGMLMTENAFYPVFLCAALALVRALERPTRGRQLTALALIGIAFVARAQAVALVPALVTAVLVLAALDSRADGERVSFAALRARLRAWAPTWLALGLVALAAPVAQLARGSSPLELVGAYRVVAGQLEPLRFPRWLLLHVAELDLYLGVLPFAAALVVGWTTLRDRSAPRALRVFVAAALGLVLWMLLLVAAFATQPLAQLVHERNLFYVAPLFLTLFLVWIDRGLPRPRRVAALAALVAALLPLTLPFRDLVYNSAFEALALVPWSNSLLDAGAVPVAMALVASVLAGVFLLLPRRLWAVAPLLVLLTFYVTGIAARTQIENASQDGLSRSLAGPRDWVDRAVPPGNEVVALWWQRVPRERIWDWRYFAQRRALWQGELFNRRVGRFFFVGRRMPYNLPDRRLTVGGGGVLVDRDGRPLTGVRYVLAPPAARLEGVVVARDAKTHLALVRVSGTIRTRAAASGRPS